MAVDAVWRAGAIARNWAYDRRGAIARASVPVISIGNLAFGGRGKTPFVRWLARRLREGGRRPAVLSRGYGRQARGPVRVEAASPAERVGDEPRMLFRSDPWLVVVVDGDRARGAQIAVEAGADVILLDDGFQHRRLHRDLDVVLVAEGDLEGRCPPAGDLREPPASLRRADLIVRTGRWLAPVHPGEVAIETRARSLSKRPLSSLRGESVALVAAMARPERFERTVIELGARVQARLFLRDHAPILPWAVRRLRARNPGLSLITTEKDEARLDGAAEGLGLEVLSIDVEVCAGRDRVEAAVERVLGGWG